MHTCFDNRLTLNYANKFIEMRVGNACCAKCCKPSTVVCSVRTRRSAPEECCSSHRLTRIRVEDPQAESARYVISFEPPP